MHSKAQYVSHAMERAFTEYLSLGTMLHDIWTRFCDSAEPLRPNSCGSSCIDGLKLTPTFSMLASAHQIPSCLRHAVIIATELLFLFLFSVLLIAIHWRSNSSQKYSRIRRTRFDSSLFSSVSSPAAAVAAVGSSGLALWLFGCGSDRIPIHELVRLLVQGVTWLVLAVCTKLQVQNYLVIFFRTWWISLFVLSSVEAILSVVDLTVGKESGASASRIGSLLLWPVCLLFLINALILRRKREEDSQSGRDSQEEPLLQGISSEDDTNIQEEDENITPFASAGIFSKAAFLWLGSILQEGYKRPLEQDDIPNLGPSDRSEVAVAKFLAEWKKRKERNPSGKLTVQSVLAACYWRDLLGTGFFAGLKVIMALSGPVLLNTFINYTSGVRLSPYDGYVIVLGLFIAKMLESLAQRQWNFGSRRLGMQLRSSLIGAIFRKELKLSNAGRQKHSTGEVVNYMVVDAYRVGEGPDWLHRLWTTPLQIAVALVILAYTVQWATLSGLAVIILTMFVNVPLARAERRSLNHLMAAQDDRLRATSEALRNMKILKVQAWELRFLEEIGKLRQEEMRWLRSTQVQQAYKSFIFWMTPIFVSVATFATCVFLNIPLNASSVFTALATLRIVQEPIRALPDIIAAVIQASVAMGRITIFLQEDELQADAVDRSPVKRGDTAISMHKAVLSWESDAATPTLREIDFDVKHGQHVAVCGPVGAGKSSLLYSILGETLKLSGDVKVSGTVAYVAQTAWIQSGTVRDNILFGKPMDKDRYEQTIKACALDSDIENFEYGDLTEIGERGINMSGGQKQRIQLARAVYQDADIYLLDDPFSAVDVHTGAIIFKDCVRGALLDKTVILVTHQVEFLPAADYILLLKDGEIQQSGRYTELDAAGSAFADLVSAHKETMDLHSNHIGNDSSSGSSRESDTADSKPNLDGKQTTGQAAAGAWKNENQLIKKEEQEYGDTGTKPYWDYLSQASGVLYLLGAASAVTIILVGQLMSTWWMAANVDKPRISMVRLVGVYALINFGSGGFFDSTPLGRILSRVSSDLQILDNLVPMAFGFTLSSTMNAVTTLVVTAFVTWQTLIGIIPVILINRWLQYYYLSSARQLMRINATSKSPIVNHFGETIAGTTTIRAFRREKGFKEKNQQHINHNNAPYFYMISANEWLVQRLDVLCTCLLCLCALVMVILPAGTFEPGFAGLVLTYGLTLNLVMVVSVTNECILANNVISMERVKQYMYNEPEAPAVIPGSRPPENWPSQGKIEITNLQVRYRPNTPLVLRGITCTIDGGQRVGVVGRTGSGKTTLISSLFRLVEPSGGSILLDGLNISTIGLHDLRSRLSIIPQEPALFRGTVRFNLDPLGDYSDHEIWKALDKCQLGDVIRSKDGRLDFRVTDDGENWSVGQRQLFCLGRVLLKRSRVLFLDEATASIDNTTDAILQRVIREEFKDSTVITVAHRIPTVIDSDMVMALSDGLLMEYDQPAKLLQDSSSFFARLVAEYWSHSQNATKSK
ncbi:hypothetical protein R1sor_015753 [Riccia sorocarpa]|uniref:Uncharacterized protein n=1 Tax=Riccia sorocarpa TaxID=122646 RepID=A0ABD3HG63_9MARC